MDPIQDHHHHQQQQHTTNSQIPKHKRHKIPKPEPQDRLFSLPKHLLLHILSFLPTKYAVRTGILSKHWLYLWTSLPVLDFHNPDDPCNDRTARPGPMVTFIDRALFLYDFPKIQKLTIRLLYHQRYVSNVNLWLRLATRKKVEELELDFDLYWGNDIYNDDIYDEGPIRYQLPQFLLKSESLVRLKLIDCEIVPNGQIDWENLGSLSISNVPLSSNAIRKIVLGCPSLNFLELCYCYDFDILEINYPGVRELVIHGDPYSSIGPNISVPYVQKLCIFGAMEKFRIVNAASLIVAKLDFYVRIHGYYYEEDCLFLKDLGSLIMLGILL